MAAGPLALQQWADRRTAALALLDSWLAEAATDPSEQRDTGTALIRGLDANRAEAGERPLFPPEREGVTW